MLVRLLPHSSFLRSSLAAGFLLASLTLGACKQEQPAVVEKAAPQEIAAPSLRMAIPDFEDGARFPMAYSTEGENASPPISWSEVPEGTEAYAVTLEDLDAAEGEPAILWVVYNIPARATGLPANLPEGRILPGAIQQATNDYGEAGYHGPEPVPGSHRYRFTLYALESALELDAREEVAAAIVPAIKEKALASATIEGKR